MRLKTILGILIKIQYPIPEVSGMPEQYSILYFRPRKKCLFPVTVRKKGYKGQNFFFGHLFLSKMCVLCMFYADWELGGRKKL